MNTSAEPVGLYRVVQDSEDRIETLPMSVAAAEILASTPFAEKRPDAYRLLSLATDLAEEITCSRLHCRKTAAFWELLPS